jgi:alkanesulfonate monooxygenase
MPTDAPSPRLFSTCPPSSAASGGADYLRRVAEVGRWSEEHGCEGALVYTDNGLVDPWLVSQVLLQHTRSLRPLVAVQPVYLHPYAAAKMVASLGHLFGRGVHLNLVAGGFKNDLDALGDPTPHDRRYARLVEYAEIVQRLLSGEGPVTLHGEFYRVEGLRLSPALEAHLRPETFVSGSSEAGRAAAARLGALAVEYPRPAAEYAPKEDAGTPRGIRIGVIAREDAEAAWTVAHARFPADRRGQITHQLAMRTSDSDWHRQLSRLARQSALEDRPYWLLPFENYKTFCPYLVGSHDRVGEEISRYLEAGYGTFILDVPAEAGDLEHARRAFARAAEMVAR